MPLYEYIAFTEAGKKESGYLDCANESDAYDRLTKLAMTTVKLSIAAEIPQEVPWYRRQLKFREKTLSISIQADVAEQLATLFAAKLTVLEVLRIVETGAEQKIVRSHFKRVKLFVSEGVSFADAFSQAGNNFSPIFVTLIRFGDKSANFVEALKILARHMRRSEGFRSEIMGALIYPLILILAAILLFLFVLFYLVPGLLPLFESVGKPIPPSLSFLNSMKTFLTNNIFWIFSIALILSSSMTLYFRTPSNKRILVLIISKLPIIGPMIKISSLSHLTRSLELLLRSGSSLLEALRNTHKYFEGSVYSSEFGNAADNLEGGGRAWRTLEAGGEMPSMFLELFRIGEETNTLPEVLSTLGQTLEAKLERQIKSTQKMVTPTITLLLGGAVGLLVVSVLGAMLSINDLAF